MISYPLATDVGTGTGAALAGMTPVTGGLEGAMRLGVVINIDTVGATPALSFQVEASMTGVDNWVPVALVAPDSTVAASSAAVAVSPTPAAGVKFVRYVAGLDSRFFKAMRINVTANTNVTKWDAELQRVDN